VSIICVCMRFELCIDWRFSSAVVFGTYIFITCYTAPYLNITLTVQDF
jgi:hypothetical protein